MLNNGPDNCQHGEQTIEVHFVLQVSITEHIESISVLRVLAVRTLLIPTDETLKVYLVLAVPASVQNLSRYLKHTYCEKARSTSSSIVSNIFSPKYWKQLTVKGWGMYARHTRERAQLRGLPCVKTHKL